MVSTKTYSDDRRQSRSRWLRFVGPSITWTKQGILEVKTSTKIPVQHHWKEWFSCTAGCKISSKSITPISFIYRRVWRNHFHNNPILFDYWDILRKTIWIKKYYLFFTEYFLHGLFFGKMFHGEKFILFPHNITILSIITAFCVFIWSLKTTVNGWLLICGLTNFEQFHLIILKINAFFIVTYL